MFFYLSKVFWFFADPGNAFLFALLLGFALAMTRFKKLGKGLIMVSISFALLISVVPVGSMLSQALEHRFPPPKTLPDSIAGIVVLGGVIDPYRSEKLKTPAIGGAVERITVSAKLAKAYPDARLIYTGGSGSLRFPEQREADYVTELYGSLGISNRRLELEREARNTWENAKFSIEIASPGTEENWLLVTSAFHMPRAVGVFRRVGWELIPYPVDFNANVSESFPSPLSFTNGLNQLSHAGHEWIGLIAYWLTGKNSAAFPKPRNSKE